MARTNLAVQRITRAGLDPSFTAANVDGHSITNDGDVFVTVKNGSASAITATFITPYQVAGLNVEDLAVSVPAGGERDIGRFPPATFGRALDIDFSAVDSVTVAART